MQKVRERKQAHLVAIRTSRRRSQVFQSLECRVSRAPGSSWSRRRRSDVELEKIEIRRTRDDTTRACEGRKALIWVETLFITRRLVGFGAEQLG